MTSTDAKAIRLDQFLKLCGAADSGGHAKVMVQSGQVKVNGEVELRRGRKLQMGDLVKVEGGAFTVNERTLADEAAPTEPSQ